MLRLRYEMQSPAENAAGDFKDKNKVSKGVRYEANSCNIDYPKDTTHQVSPLVSGWLQSKNVGRKMVS